MSSHNPRGQFPRRDQPVPDVETAAEGFARRLRLLGADDDVVVATLSSWDDPEWTNRDLIVALSDAALVAEIAAIETEYRISTMTEDEEEAERYEARQAIAAKLLEHGIADDVRAWITAGYDDAEVHARAFAVFVAESEGRERGEILAITYEFDPGA